jgi:hypothetical protein
LHGGVVFWIVENGIGKRIGALFVVASERGLEEIQAQWTPQAAKEIVVGVDLIEDAIVGANRPAVEPRLEAGHIEFRQDRAGTGRVLKVGIHRRKSGV